MILPDCLILDYRDLSENYLKQQRIPKVGSSFSGLPAPFGFAPQIRTFVSSTPLTIWPRHLIPFYCGRQAPLPFWCHISHSKDHFKMCLDPDLLCREPIKTTVCYSGPLALGNLQLVSALNSNSPTIFSHKPKHVVSLSRYCCVSTTSRVSYSGPFYFASSATTTKLTRTFSSRIPPFFSHQQSPSLFFVHYV